MKLHFSGDVSELETGIRTLAPVLGFDMDANGIPVNVERHAEPTLRVSRDRAGARIRYSAKITFFRALGLLVEHLRDGEEAFQVTEEVQFDTNGVMFDVSQGNAVINLENVTTILTHMALMGLNMLMLYAEDSYDLKGHPRFGYMRSRYSQEELKSLDDYAFVFGIEMIPCIQTLAHLIDALKWVEYSKMKDDDDTLLVGEEKTYQFIEDMIVAASAPFRSRRIHIGMDEAWKLGQGEYLKKNGYKDKFEIMTYHLNRVVEITRRHNLRPMIWSDMYFRAGSKTGDYYDAQCVIPRKVMESTPRDVQLVYWDYYHAEEGFYRDWIRRHAEFGAPPIFAGGLWSWTGFSMNYGVTFTNTNAALNACKKEKVREVFATIWGDDNTECNIYANLLGMQLFAEHGYSAEVSEDKIRKRFTLCTGADFDDFLSMRYVDEVPGTAPGNPDNCNCSKYIMWQDILIGLFDKNVEGHGLSSHYEKLAADMKDRSTRNGKYGFVFAFLMRVCSVLSLKAEMGIRLTEAYRAGDKSLLEHIASEELPELSRRVSLLRVLHRDLWMQINKPMGWEVLDLRYGALLMRIDTAISRLNDHQGGKLRRIEELEEERLFYQEVHGLIQCNTYNRMPTASRISATTFYNYIF